MRRREERQLGSALIITMLVVTVLVAIGFSVSRLTISEITQSARLEDSELAYQAAEGGVEMGLLYYRYNHNAEIPTNITGGVSADTPEAMRYNLTDSTVVNPDQTISDYSGMDAQKSYFDLKMYHLNDTNVESVGVSSCDQKRYDLGLCVATPDDSLCTGDVSCYSASDGKNYLTPALMQDGVVEYDAEGVDRIKMQWQYLEDVNSMSPAEQNSVNLLFLPIDENGEIINDNKSLYPSIYTSAGKNLSNITRIRLKPFGANLKSYTITASEPSDVKMDSRYTVIESTGYYGNAKRKLKVKLDRATGSLLSPYDFLIYSNQ